MAIVNGTAGDDFIHRAGDGLTPPPGSNDIPETTAGADEITGGAGADTIFGDGGDDVANIDVSNDGADVIDLGAGADSVSVGAAGPTQVRLAFTSAEVGNGSVNDSGLLTNQDGGLAVRMQAENGSDGLTGPITRVDDEGVTFVADAGVTFDVRDLVSGAARGDRFEVVTLGTLGNDTLGAAQSARPYYINGGQGDDVITDGTADDFLVGGAGNDTLTANLGDDSFIGGAGSDRIVGRAGDDVAIHNITTDGADQINLGLDNDTVTVNANAATEVRLTFTSAEVGNRLPTDSGLLANQDGLLAVRMQAENGSDALTGPISRVDDESVSFVGGAGVTFDVRDLVSGAARGDQFQVVTLGSFEADTLGAVQAARPYYINGGGGDDTITDGTANDFLVGGAGADTLTATLGADSFIGGGGSDSISGGLGTDTAIHNITTDGADRIDLGADSDTVTVNANAATQVRLGFTSAEVGNGSATDSGALANQDGGLAVRMQAENGSDGLTGPITRVDDEGVTFVGGAGVTFDVRDLVSGAARGDAFEVVTLGTSGADTLGAVQAARPYYINGGGGADTITDGTANDFLVGGAGNDTLTASLGNDSFIGGGGDDFISGGSGNDVAIHNITTDGADQINLGADSDTVTVNATAATEVRLTFTSAEVGNGSANDSGLLANQDGGLGVRMQAENGSDGLTGPVTRVDDEAITFVGGAGVTFDVRDLVTGAARGDDFQVVTLGSSAGDTLGAAQALRPYYINGGQGNDVITDGTADDFLVGGAGNDTLTANLGDDSFIGGAGADRIVGRSGNDVAIHNITTDGADQVNLGGGADTVTVNANAATEVRLTFTSAEVGDNSPTDSNTMANQDGLLAVRMQAENGADGLTGPITRVDDEGITFVGGAGVTFDVRDLVSGVERGDEFEVVTLGTSAGDTLGATQAARPYYINGGGGNDVITDGTADDFLVGGAGDDTLTGSLGDDSFIGGGGVDIIEGGAGNDVLTGGLGADQFVFRSALGPTNVDSITDYSAGSDGFRLDNAVFLTLVEGALDEEAFHQGAAATKADDRIIYDSATGGLFYDRDGSDTGFEQVRFATVTAGTNLGAGDFVVI